MPSLPELGVFELTPERGTYWASDRRQALFGDIRTVTEPKHLYNVTKSVTLNPSSTTCQLGDAG